MKAYHEHAITFGPGRSLVGVLTTPANGGRSDAPAFVILNAGVIHRVGANRLHVRLARELAARGHHAFRFDLSGIGDSDPRVDEADLERAVRYDIADALTELEALHGVRSFVLFGLCSGANNSFTYAVTDPRVIGAVLIDPAAFRTLRFYITHYVPRVFRLSTWTNILTGRNARIRQLRARFRGQLEGAERDPEPDPEPDLAVAAPIPAPNKEAMDRGLETLIARGVELLVVFTGGLLWEYNYHSQFRDTFPRHARSDRVRVEFFRHADHTFTAEAVRASLIKLVAEWLADRIEAGVVTAQARATSIASIAVHALGVCVAV